MRLMFNLFVTLLVAGGIWWVATRIIDAFLFDDDLNGGLYVPSTLCVAAGFFGLLILGIVAIWRI